MGTYPTRKQAQPIYSDVADVDDFYDSRMPSSTRRYKVRETGDDVAMALPKGPFIQQRASRRTQGQGVASKAVAPSLLSEGKEVRRFPKVMLFMGAITALLLIMGFSVLTSWWQGEMDNITYGYPRTSQLDAVVGHHDSATNKTHFIFLNLHGHIEVIEIPGGDASQARIFTGPTLFGPGQDLIPVTGEIRSENGRLDLILHIQNQQITFINDGKTFHEQ